MNILNLVIEHKTYSKFKLIFKLILSILIFLQLKLVILNSYEKESLPRELISVNKSTKINACLFILTRNQDLNDLIETVEQFENAFNHNFNYPYVIVSETELSSYFKDQIKRRTASKIEFGIIPKEEFSIPKWINQTKLKLNLESSSINKIFKGSSLSYHHMCRYYSGFFFRHRLTLKYDYYWRIDSDSKFPCTINQDPFLELNQNNQLYGFSLSILEDFKTMPTLWSKFKNYFKPISSAKSIRNDSALNYIASLKTFKLESLCVFWNNFEIASFSLFRNPDYIKYFDYLDQAGGFYYERWGDAPVHTYYVLFKLNHSQIKRFDNIGYGHTGRYNWPLKKETRDKCLKRVHDDLHLPNCNKRWDNLNKI